MDGIERTPKMRELEENVRASRDELAGTVEELVGWFDPKTRVTSAVGHGRKLMRDAVDPSSDPADRKRALIAVGVAAALAVAVVAGVVRRLGRR
jgi:hypothetical protein